MASRSCPWAVPRTTGWPPRRARPWSAWAPFCSAVRIYGLNGSRTGLEPCSRLLRHRRGGRALGRGGLRRRGARAALRRAGQCQRAPAGRPPLQGEFEDWSEPEPAGGGAKTAVLRSAGGRRPLEAVASASVRVHLVVPRSFNDAQSIADKFKDAVPVILNLQGTDVELSSD